METSSQEERLAETRVKNAKELGAEVISTACPFCVLTLEDAVKSTYLEEKIKVMEITEILGVISSS